MPAEMSVKYPDLTQREALLLDWIIAFIGEHDSIPSGEDMSEGFGWKSRNTGFRLIESLHRAGYLRRRKRETRNLRLNYDKLPGPLISARLGKVQVLNMPARMTPEKAMRVGQRLIELAEELGVSDGEEGSEVEGEL